MEAEMNPFIDSEVTTCLIAFSLRSGSNFLCDCLTENGLGQPTEYFQYPFGDVNGWCYDELSVSRSDFPGFLKALFQQRSKNGIFAAKVAWDHKNALLEAIQKSFQGVTTFSEVFPRLRWIHIERRDKIGQAISLARAVQSGQWSSSDEARPFEFEYDFFLLLSYLQTILAESYFWHQFFDSVQVPVLRVAYEDFVVQPRETVLAIQRHLQPATTPSGNEGIRIPTRFQAQRDPRSSEIRKAFMADLDHIGAAGYWQDRTQQLSIWSSFFSQRRWQQTDQP